MSWLPLYFKPQGRSVLVLGTGDLARRKIRAIQSSDIKVIALCSSSAPAPLPIDGAEIVQYQSFESLLELDVFQSAFVAIAATDDDLLNTRFAVEMRSRNLPVHVVQNIDESDFLLPAVIDRGAISVAVSTSGQHPTLARLIRTQIESVLPSRLEALSELALSFRSKVTRALTSATTRRAFWEQVLEGRVADLVYGGRDAEAITQLNSDLDGFVDCQQVDTGEVYLVGAGPGDPDLLSFKALRLIRQADVVLYDRLVSPQILSLARQDADMIDVGKRRADHTMPQDGINALLANLAKLGKRVLRLKGGDPFIFGRGGEEIETLAAQNIPFQVVPGITAASGCASYAGIPLTHRDHAQSVRFVTGHLKDNTSALEWDSLVSPNQTLVFYMGLVALPIISEQLLSHGMSADMPVAVISKGTLPDQEVLISTLARVANEVSASGLRAPTIIIIGNVVSLHEKLNWA